MLLASGMKPQRNALVTVAALSVSIGLMAPASGTANVAAPHRDQKTTPVILQVPTEPSWFKGMDGRFHLQYEVLLTNAVPIEAQVKAIDILGKGGRSVARLSGDELASRMGLQGSAPTTTMNPNSTIPVWIDLTVNKRRSVPRTVKHRLTITIPDGLPIGPRITYTAPRVAVARQAARVIAPPLPGGRWVGVIGAHRRALAPIDGRLRLGQRFAVDFAARLNRTGRTHRGSSSKNSSYFNYGTPLLAVGDGKVVAAVDRYPSQIPNAQVPVTGDALDGNHVIIKLDDGVYAGYAHMKPGSVRVRPGQRVKAGQVLGRLGNSGGSTGPHLHFQLMDRPSLLDANGLPFTIDRLRFNGVIPDLEAFVEEDLLGNPVQFNPSGAGKRREQGFDEAAVVTFR